MILDIARATLIITKSMDSTRNPKATTEKEFITKKKKQMEATKDHMENEKTTKEKGKRYKKINK